MAAHDGPVGAEFCLEVGARKETYSLRRTGGLRYAAQYGDRRNEQSEADEP